MNTILTPEEAKSLGRPIGKVSNDKIQAFIAEVEQTVIRKRLGDSLYITLLTTNHEEDDTYKTLLDGGQYENSRGEIRFLAGLKVAIAYYVYAQNVRAGDFESTRYGMVRKDDEYSSPISAKERDMAANNATEIADNYMKELLAYCFEVQFLSPKDSGVGMGLTNGCIIRRVKSY